MQVAKLSFWNNKWSDVFDFTPVKEGDDVHFTVKHQLQEHFIAPFAQIKSLFEKVNQDRKALGVEDTNLIKDLNEEEQKSLLEVTV